VASVILESAPLHTNRTIYSDGLRVEGDQAGEVVVVVVVVAASEAVTELVVLVSVVAEVLVVV
jgi:hypothetical protein